jgi:hypothetical protein
MNRTRYLAFCALLAMSIASSTIVIAGQQPSQTSPAQPDRPPATSQVPPATPSPTSPGSQSRAAAQQITVTGCIQREADYRRATGAGRGGPAGTGVGVANEFVLANAMMSTGGRPGTTPGVTSAAPTGTTGSAASATAYELTGPNEAKAETYVGKRVEISGTLKPTDTNPAGGPTANVPGSRDLKLAELEISTIRETTGTCSTTPQP